MGAWNSKSKFGFKIAPVVLVIKFWLPDAIPARVFARAVPTSPEFFATVFAESKSDSTPSWGFDIAASAVDIGLDYDVEVQTLPPIVQSQPASGQAGLINYPRKIVL